MFGRSVTFLGTPRVLGPPRVPKTLFVVRTRRVLRALLSLETRLVLGIPFGVEIPLPLAALPGRRRSGADVVALEGVVGGAHSCPGRQVPRQHESRLLGLHTPHLVDGLGCVKHAVDTSHFGARGFFSILLFLQRLLQLGTPSPWRPVPLPRHQRHGAEVVVVGVSVGAGVRLGLLGVLCLLLGRLVMSRLYLPGHQRRRMSTIHRGG
mmetsp:Transcript_4509/g.11119  ORF Transcript_4509/g.11119 Transcript_4509/m.11119 type:complete len:208 (-) Transcript_4509:77-700(-)